jgi:sialic acid synthase SpsE
MGLKRLVRDIRLIDKILGIVEKKIHDSERENIKKLRQRLI